MLFAYVCMPLVCAVISLQIRRHFNSSSLVLQSRKFGVQSKAFVTGMLYVTWLIYGVALLCMVSIALLHLLTLAVG